MSLNRIVLIGRLTRDPESQYTSSGIALAKFSIAVDRDFKNAETGEKETDFINCVAWRRTAEFVTQYIAKGRLIAVDGRLQIRTYVAQDGVKKYVTEVVAENVQGLDRPKDDAEGGYQPTTSGGAHTANPPVNDVDDNDPFADE